MKIRTKIHGRVHSDVADTLISLGKLYNKMEVEKKAHGYFEEALQIRIKLFGKHDEKIKEVQKLMNVSLNDK